MPIWLVRLSNVIWSAVLAVVLSAVAILVALLVPNNLQLVIALSSSAIVSALLAQRV